MPYNPQKHRRRSTRLPHWDYSWSWWYYVTIVTKERRSFLGYIEDDAVVLSTIGKAADRCWKEIPSHHEGVELDDYVIMPNHVHGIIIIGESRKGLTKKFSTHVSKSR